MVCDLFDGEGGQDPAQNKMLGPRVGNSAGGSGTALGALWGVTGTSAQFPFLAGKDLASAAILTPEARGWTRALERQPAALWAPARHPPSGVCGHLPQLGQEPGPAC